MGTLANSEDPDGMQHRAAFHQGLTACQNLKKTLMVEFRKFYLWALKVHNEQSHT